MIILAYSCVLVQAYSFFGSGRAGHVLQYAVSRYSTIHTYVHVAGHKYEQHDQSKPQNSNNGGGSIRCTATADARHCLSGNHLNFSEQKCERELLN